MTMKPRLEEKYLTSIKPELQKKLGLTNVMQVPYLDKIVLNVGVKDGDDKLLQIAEKILTKISGQKAVRTRARKSIAGFKLREGMPIGVKVTLRKRKMYEFLDRLLAISLPSVRDLQGVPLKLDGQGNYNLGIKEWVIFPEIDYDMSEKIIGLNITFATSTKNDSYAFELLKSFGMPFRRQTR